MHTPRSALDNLYDPADIAEAAAYEAHRELDIPRRHRLDVNDEIASENRAIARIERSIVDRSLVRHTCAYCSAG